MKENAIKKTQILLPNTDDYTAWACIACDQFTSEIKYWQQLEKEVGDKKSTLKLTLPEIYLEDNAEERIKGINTNIKNYLDGGVFKKLKNKLDINQHAGSPFLGCKKLIVKRITII